MAHRRERYSQQCPGCAVDFFFADASEAGPQTRPTPGDVWRRHHRGPGLHAVPSDTYVLEMIILAGLLANYLVQRLETMRWMF